jgi:SPP1 family predicted phage head-tail adaptor
MTEQLSGSWLGINPGRLRHRVSIEYSTQTQDGTGQPIDEWHLLAEVPASIEPLVGRELTTAQQTYAEVTHKLTVRYAAGRTSGITPKNRITLGTRIFDIGAVLNLEERNLLIQIMAKERIGAGLNGQCE